MITLIRRILLGCSAGMIAGALVGMVEALYLLSSTGAAEYGALFYAVVLYAVIGIGMGGFFGFGVMVLALIFKRLSDAMVFTLPFVGVLGALGAVITRYIVNKVIYLEQGVPMSGNLKIGALFGTLMLIGLWLGPIMLTRTPFKVLLRLRGAGAMYGGIVLLSGIFAFAPGDMDPAGEMQPVVEQPPGLASRPNVLLIMVDTLRPDYLGAYEGGEAAGTPHLDALAADGIVFEEAFAAASWTRASTASLLSSMVPSSHDTALKVSVLPDEVDTLAEVLRGQTYVTGGLPNNINVTRSFNFQQGFDWFEYQAPDYLFGASESASQLSMYNVVRKIREKLVGNSKRVSDFYQPADVVLGRAQDFIEAQGEQRWFLFSHVMEPHDPYFEHPYNGVGFARAEHEVPDADRVEYLKETYRLEIQWMDERLGEFFDWMKETGTYDDTVIVITADHGEEFLEHGGWWHGTTLYDEQIHVPLLVKMPNSEFAGTRVPWQTRLIDVAPTLASLAGAPAPDGWQGIDLFGEEDSSLLAWMALADLETQEDRVSPETEPGVFPELESLVFAEENFEGNDLTTIRVGGWKLITANEGNPRGLETRELYHVSMDPGETENRVGLDITDQNRLEQLLVEQVRAAAERAVVGTTAELDELTLERMRALGYVE